MDIYKKKNWWNLRDILRLQLQHLYPDDCAGVYIWSPLIFFLILPCFLRTFLAIIRAYIKETKKGYFPSFSLLFPSFLPFFPFPQFFPVNSSLFFLFFKEGRGWGAAWKYISLWRLWLFIRLIYFHPLPLSWYYHKN